MSLCHRFKRFWRFYWERGGTAGAKKQDRAIVKRAVDCPRLQGMLGGLDASSQCHTDTVGRWVSCEVPSSNQEMEEFNSEMDEIWHIHKDEFRQIREQHELLKTRRIMLNRRVSELERILQADQKNHSLTTTGLTMDNEELALTSEDLELISEMDEVLQMLERNQEELSDLENCLEIELRERTLYPEPVILRTRSLEDEFSKRMRLDGGLKYECHDKTVRCITHQCLPPPLSLTELFEGAAS